MECKDRHAKSDVFYYPLQIKSPLYFTLLAALEADLPGFHEWLPCLLPLVGSGQWGALAGDTGKEEIEWKFLLL